MNGKQLKNSILQWAIQGKLVPQDPNDEPASVLLERIRAEKARLVKEGKIKKDKNESIIFRGDDNSHYEKFLATGEVKCIDEEIPFEIPDGWEWIRLRMIANVARGGSPRPIKDYLTESNSGVNWIKIGDTEKGGKYINGTRERIKPEGVSKSRMIHKGDFLLTNSMSFGRPYISNIEGCIHDGWLVISPFPGTYSQFFLFYLLSSRFAYDQFCGKVSGAVVQNLNSDKVADAIIPLLPISEQLRIVERLESIMPFVYKYTVASEAQDLLNNTIRVKLKKSILQEAIQGRLVPQDPSDEPASELLKRIREEKLRLVKEGKLKKKEITDSVIFKADDNRHYEKIGGQIIDISEDIPFDIPDSWQWTRLGHIANMFTGNSISDTEKRTKYTQVNGMEYIGTKDVGFDNRINYCNGISIPSDYIPEFKIAPKNSILMCIEGGSAGKKIALTSQKVCFGNKLCCFAPYADTVSKFIYFYLQSPSFFACFFGNITGIIGGVSVNNLKKILMPLPPVNEQSRIVKQLEQLFKQFH